MSKRYKVEALGCRTNQYEAQAFRDQLETLGFVAAQDGEEADVCIINTCTVTESADSHSRHLVRKLKRQNPQAAVFATGCLAERNPQMLTGVTVIGNSQKEKLLESLFPEQELPEFSIKRFESHTRAFLKIQDGCNSFCTYCIIPYVRGRSRSRTVDEVLREAEQLIANGYKEIVLTGINIGDFDGGDPKNPTRLATLIRAVDALDGLHRLRVSSIDPDEIDDDLADAILNGKKTCHSMHIVLQAGSNVVLKRMNRKYTRQIFLETVRKLQERSPDFTVTTDIIVGFPGETDSDFAETLDVMREVCFAKVHMFPYSDRPRTRSASYPNKISQEVMHQRKADVLALSEQMAFVLRKRFIGRAVTVLTEEQKDTYTFGHTANFLPVCIHGTHTTNELFEVVCEENSPMGLIGKIR